MPVIENRNSCVTLPRFVVRYQATVFDPLNRDVSTATAISSISFGFSTDLCI